MNDHDALLAAMRQRPEDDTLRLVYADWREEHGEQERAEFVRLQIEFEPLREDYESERADDLRRQFLHLGYGEPSPAWLSWLGPLKQQLFNGVRREFRRGFLDEIALPAKWFLEHGQAIHANCPLLRRVALFRVNGWGERVAACEWLEGLPELEIACWAGPEDYRALARSPHLKRLEVLQVWEQDRDIGRMLARAEAWPGLRELRLLGLEGVDESDWLKAVNEAAGREIAAHLDFYNEPISFAPIFGLEYHCGRLPDGRAAFIDASDEPYHMLVYHDDGAIQEERELPPMTLPEGKRPWGCKEQVQQYLRQLLGFTPAFIRVKEVRFTGQDYPYTYRYRGSLEEEIGLRDDPTQDPEDAEEPGGCGEGFYSWVKEGGYVFDCGNDWWCGRDGRVHST